MKNKNLLKASGVLLVLTLISSCFVGGTFAKYVTKGEGSDTARVAKWGVDANVEDDIFGIRYNSPDGSHITVESATEVVAPGTNGTFKGVELTGTPEVAYRVTLDADLDLGDPTQWMVPAKEGDSSATEFYCPIIIEGNGIKRCGLNYSSASEFEAAVEELIESRYSSGKENEFGGTTPNAFAPGTSLDTLALLNIDYDWYWPFDDSDPLYAEFTDKPFENDPADWKDTYLGDLAADNPENAPKITLKVIATVTQID